MRVHRHTSLPLSGMMEVEPIVMTFFFCFEDDDDDSDDDSSSPLLLLLLLTAVIWLSGIATSESSSMLLQPMRPG